MNRFCEILCNMFDCVIAWGHWPEAAGDPCKSIAFCRRPPHGGCSVWLIWRRSALFCTVSKRKAHDAARAGSRLHDLRHGYALPAVTNDEGLKLVERQIGHD